MHASGRRHAGLAATAVLAVGLLAPPTQGASAASTGLPVAGAEAAAAAAPTVNPPGALEGAGGDRGVGLTWGASSSSGITGYEIHRSTSSTVPPDGPVLAKTSATSRTFIDSAVSNGTTYRYLVRAVAGSTKSAPTATVSVRPQAPAVPTGATITWAVKASSALARAEANGAVTGGKAYVFGGQYDGVTQTLRSDRYDPATNRWTRLKDLPQLVTHAPVVPDGTKLWILGGYVGLTKKDSTRSTWVYDTVTNTYKAGPALPAARGGGGAALVGRALHYFSGAVRKDSVGAVVRDYPDHWVLDLDAPTTWTPAPPVPNPRNHVAAQVLGTKVYLVGGQHSEYESTTPQKQVDVYDTVTRTWSRAADLPVPRGHISASTFAWNGRIVVLGGSVLGAGPSSTFYEYNPATNAWTTRTRLPQALRSPIAVLLNGKVLLHGGRSSSGPSAATWSGSTTATAAATASAPAAGTWSASTPLPTSLLDGGGAAIGSTIYVVGGKTSAGPVSVLRRYSTVSGVWSTRASLPGPAVENPAVVAHNGFLYAAGGSTAAFSGAVRTLFRYSPSSNTWTRLADMASARGGAAAVVHGGSLWVIGGMSGSGASLATTERYDLTRGTWSAGPALAVARDNPGAASAGGQLVVFGGRTRSASGTEVAGNLASTQVLSSAGTSWTAGPSMITGRRAMAVGVVNGKVIAAGGEKQPSGATWPQTESYDPVSRTWRSLAAMPTPRHGAAAAVVSGKLHTLGGGSVGGSSYTRAHEVLTPPG